MATLFCVCGGLNSGSNIVQRANSIRPYTAYYQSRVFIYPTIIILAHPLIPSILVQILQTNSIFYTATSFPKTTTYNNA